VSFNDTSRSTWSCSHPDRCGASGAGPRECAAGRLPRSRRRDGELFQSPRWAVLGSAHRHASLVGSAYDVSLTGRGLSVASPSGQGSSWGPTPRCSASRAPGRCGVFSAYLGLDTTAGQLPAGRQLLLAPTATPGNRRRRVRAAAHVSPPQVQNSSSSPEPDLEWLSQRSGCLRNLWAQRSPDL
jgi:hypothetical protein